MELYITKIQQIAIMMTSVIDKRVMFMLMKGLEESFKVMVKDFGPTSL